VHQNNPSEEERYYTNIGLFPHKKDKAIKAWKLISNGQSPEFFQLKNADPTLPCKTCMEFFGNQFYRRLLEVNLTVKSMFTKTTMKQGTLLLNMISFTVSELENEEKFTKRMQNLAHSHKKVGVEYKG
jgi:hypothetical protein